MTAAIVIGALLAWCVSGVLLIRTNPDLADWLVMMSDTRCMPAPVFWAALAAIALCGPITPLASRAAVASAMLVVKVMRLG